MKTKLLSSIVFLFSLNFAFAQNYALSLNGTTDKASMPNPFPGGAPTVFTIEWWIKPNSLSNWNQCISTLTTGWGAFVWHTTADAEVYCGTNESTRFTNTNLPAGSVDLSNWQHWAFTFNAGLAKVYKNGVLIASKTGMAAPSAWTGLYLGFVNQPLSGLIDELRVWSTEQTQVQIQTNMFANVASGTTGLLSYYKFDDKASVATDYSGNTKNGILTGCTYAANDMSVDYALSFNGTSDKGSLPNPFSSTPLAFTIEWWAMPTTTVNYNQSIGTAWGSFMFHTDANGQVYVGTDVNNRLSPSNGLGPNTMIKNTWQHFAFSFNGGTGGTGKFYKNGVLIASKAGLSNPVSFSSIGLGSHTESGTDFLINGMIDDLKIWSVARSDNDVAYDMYAKPVPNTPGLEGYWNFNDKIAGALADSSGKALAGTITGGTYMPYVKPMIVTKASNPVPGHGLLLHSDTLRLKWTGPDAYTWDVYVGTSQAAVSAATKTSPEYKGTVVKTSYEDLALTLTRKTTYWWRVDANSPAGVSAKGATWGVIYPDTNLIRLQKEFRSWKYGMFLHLGLETFSSPHVEWVNTSGTTYTPANFTMASTLNCGQWADAAKAAGMKYMVLTTRHHCGFSLWDTKQNTFDVATSSYKRDIIKQYTDSCRSRGLKVGLYYSIWDRNGESLAYVKAQLTELLSNYGNIDILWFDGWGWKMGYGTISWEAVREHIRSLQPNCIVLENNKELNFFHSDIIAFERNVDGIPQANKPYSNECMETCGNVLTTGGDNGFGNWFYSPGTECGTRTDNFHITTYTGLQTANCNYLLDVTPGQNGLVPQCQVDQLVRVAKALGIEPKTQTISFTTELANVHVGVADIQLSATASSRLPVTFVSSDTTVASINNGKLCIKKAGPVVISAVQNGNADYYPALTIKKEVLVTVLNGINNVTESFCRIETNPVKSMLSIISAKEINKVTVKSITGKSELVFPVLGNQCKCDVSTLRSGVYFVYIQSPSATTTYKFIKE